MGWAYIPVGRHWLGLYALYFGVGAAAGLIAATMHEIARWLEQRPFAAARKFQVAPAFYGLAAGIAVLPTAIWTFSGARVSKTVLSSLGPILFVVAAALAVAGYTWLGQRARQLASQQKQLLPALFSGLSVVLGLGLIVIDQTVFVALYSRLHTLLEAAATLILTVSFSFMLSEALKRVHLLGPVSLVIAGVGTVSFSAFLFLSPARTWLDYTLSHVWLEEVYAGRMLRRVQTLEAFVSNPTGFDSLAMARVERLKERYGIESTVLDPSWNELPAEPPEVQKKLAALRSPWKPKNIIVYYVDTLRQDVATDPSVMPNVARFAAQSLDFRRAYATGSDTLRSLPGLTGGNYDVGRSHDNDLCRVAESAPHESALIAARSAREFLKKLRPEFKFEYEREIADYPEGKQVWGYGADRPTAKRIVDSAVEYLKSRRDRNFFLWLFNFDQHSWRELDDDYVNEQARIHQVPKEAPLNFRYRAVATAIDAQFGRLIREIDRLKLRDNTVVLFVSDHGEGLGRDGFWVHSVFLWDSLIRVPLIMRIPGIAPRRINEVVSLADVAPTLARYMLRDPRMDGYQGEDLLRYVAEKHPERRKPLLLSAASKDQLVRVGLIEPKFNAKLVLSLEAALPEYYLLDRKDSDANNLAQAEQARVLSMLSQLVRSPVFPREPDDFDMRKSKGVRPARKVLKPKETRAVHAQN